MVQNADPDDVSLVANHRDADDAWSTPLAEPPPEPTDQAHRATPALKYTTFDDQPGSTHNLVVGLVPPGAHVLEIGCATGYMSEVLRQRLGCTVVGVEIDREAAADAVGRADRVVVGDAETLDWDELLEDERFDAILFADVLEHLRDPAAVLQRVGPLLNEGGVVVASVPNVAHVSVRLALLGGEFRYTETGLLDATHLRFFTRASLRDLFEQCGFVVSQWLRTRQSLEESEVRVPRAAFDEHALALASADDEATTYQFVVRAVPAEHATLLADERSAADERELALQASLGEAANALAERDAALAQRDAALAESAAALEAALRDVSDMNVRLVAAEAQAREREDAVDRLANEVEALSRAQAELFADLAEARAVLARQPLLRARRALAVRYPAVQAAYRRLRQRAG